MSAHSPMDLKIEYAINPSGIDVARPRFFWRMNDARRGARQTAYQILAGLRPGKADLWDTGKVNSDASTQIEYAGIPLQSRQRIYWQVRIWDADEIVSDYSAPAFFEMGLIDQKDWKASWITLDQARHTAGGPAIYLRHGFDLPGKVASARLYITARGVYVPFINGQRIGQDRFAPGWTEYKTRIAYQTYDVTTQLQQGANAVAAILGDGWYCGRFGWVPKDELNRPWLLAQLNITLTDGRTIVITTDEGWTASNQGPISAQSFMDGEAVDGRKAWDISSFGFSDSSFSHVKTENIAGSPALITQVGPTIQKIDELPVQDFWKLDNGDYVFDLGQNMVGVIRLKVRGTSGQTIVVKHGEMINGKDDRSIYTANLRTAKATDTFILSGVGEETFEPQLTYHGFRYVQISGLAGQPQKQTVTGLVYHSNTPSVGNFSCSHAKLNQLQRNIVWGQKGNFFEVPTDCPQRDERVGWTGDAQVFIRTATFNMDVAGFFNRWLPDVAYAQLPNGAFTDVVPDVITGGKMNCWGSGAPGWGDAGIICPWTLYIVYGDQRILETCYASMCRFIDYLDHRSNNGLHPDFGYGDWLAVGSETSKELIGTAYSAYSTSLMRKIANLLAKPEDERRFGLLFEKFKAAFNREFVTSTGRLVSLSQTAAVLALRFNLVDEPARSRIAEWLANDITSKGVITTGFVGCNLILPTLTQIGRDDLAWQLLANEKFPSWLFSVNQGATTIWERWDGWTPEKGFHNSDMNSFNHYAYGSCGQWMYSRIGGIELDEQFPGYKRIIINPVLAKGLTSGEASLEMLYGRVSVKWALADDQFSLEATIPPNTTAILNLPGRYIEGDVEKSMIAGQESGRTQVNLMAGSHRILSRV